MVLPRQYYAWLLFIKDEGDKAKEFYDHLKEDFEEAEDVEQVNHDCSIEVMNLCYIIGREFHTCHSSVSVWLVMCDM